MTVSSRLCTTAPPAARAGAGGATAAEGVKPFRAGAWKGICVGQRTEFRASGCFCPENPGYPHHLWISLCATPGRPTASQQQRPLRDAGQIFIAASMPFKIKQLRQACAARKTPVAGAAGVAARPMPLCTTGAAAPTMHLLKPAHPASPAGGRRRKRPL